MATAIKELARIWDSNEREDWQPGRLTRAVGEVTREARERADAWATLTELYRVLVLAGAGGGTDKRHVYSFARRSHPPHSDSPPQPSGPAAAPSHPAGPDTPNHPSPPSPEE